MVMTRDYGEGSIGAVTSTLCSLLGIAPPSLCAEPPLQRVLAELAPIPPGLGRIPHAAGEALDGAQVEKCLIYAPDALGNHLYSRYGSLFAPVLGSAPLAIPLRSVMPSVTPVCFASMFTGAPPERHGIQRPERPRPVLQGDTLFDALLRAGKRVAIVAAPATSIGRLFLGRALDYFPESYDPQVTQRVLSLLAADQHDIIVAYHQEYDDLMHETSPFDERALLAAANHVAAFAQLAEAFDRAWSRYHRAILFAPDHGAHVDPLTGRGTHGQDIPEDMEVVHFWGLRRAVRLPAP